MGRPLGSYPRVRPPKPSTVRSAMDLSTPRKLTHSHCRGRRWAAAVVAPRRKAKRAEPPYDGMDPPEGSKDSEKRA